MATARPRSVHPHRRGDGKLHTLAHGCNPGSPPQAWGRLTTRLPSERRIRFTPTGVGTAVSPPPPRLWASVHPHRRGDGTSVLTDLPFGYGSPPQAWGRLTTGFRYATASGSPPQAWGRPAAALASTATGRFTPTGVGTALKMVYHKPSGPVHPHRRGDGGQGGVFGDRAVGSPPQAWGRRAGQRPVPR